MRERLYAAGIASVARDSALVFYYDVSSPYAYLAASRVNEVLPVRPH